MIRSRATRNNERSFYFMRKQPRRQAPVSITASSARPFTGGLQRARETAINLARRRFGEPRDAYRRVSARCSGVGAVRGPC